MNKISEENPIPPKFFIAKYPIPPKFFIAKYPIPPKFDVRWEVSLIRKVRRNLFPHGLFYCIVKDSYALKLSKSSALKFWMYAEWPRTSSSAMRTYTFALLANNSGALVASSRMRRDITMSPVML